MSYFNELGLAPQLLKALESGGYDTPTPIQQQAIPPLLEGRDLCGIAQTGTGKTAAFSLPSLHHFATHPKARSKDSCRMLVLSPTRELAAQIADKIRDYGRFLNLNVQCVFGGMPIFSQKKKLRDGVDILVATPGRLLDLIDQKALHLDGVEIFVLDEADQMMDMGFIQPLKRIHALLPKQRQTLFFSATMPKGIAEMAGRFPKNPVHVSVTPQSTTAERVEQYVTFINQREKQALLHDKLKDPEIDRALIFTRTKHGADRVVRHLNGAGIKSAAIHGNKSQGQRTAAMQAFRQGKIKTLVATDIAARGIDVPGVSHVFNFELPNVAEQYVHRIGRTARAGADGIAFSFCADDERAYLKDIEKLTRIRLTQVGLPEGFRAMVESLPKPVAEPRSEERRGGRPGGGGRPSRPGAVQARSGPRGGLSRDGERRERSHTPQSGWQPNAGPADAAEGEGHRRDSRSDSRSDRPHSNTPRGERPQQDRGYQSRNRDERGEQQPRGRSFDNRGADRRPQSGRGVEGTQRPAQRTYGDDRQTAERRPRSDAPRGDRPYSDRPRGDRPQGGAPHGRSGESAENRSGNRPQHKRGGASISGNSNAGRDGERPRNYGPKPAGAAKFKGPVNRAR